MKAVQSGEVAVKIGTETERNFRGSWSGYERDRLFYNPDGHFPKFFDAAYVYGLDFDDDGRAVVPVDIDGDGDLDIVMLSLQGLRLVLNTLPHRHFARVRLAAVATEPLALGAKVRLTANGVTQQDYVHIDDGFLAQVPADLHFGLAEATRVERMEVIWPSGKVESWTDLPADHVLLVKEGTRDVQVQDLPSWQNTDDLVRTLAASLSLKAVRVDTEAMAPLSSGGKTAVVNFWGPTCAPCRKEMPAFGRLAVEHAADVEFVGVSVETGDVEAVKAAASQLGAAYPQFLANDALLAAFFGREGRAPLPSTFIFDARGRIRRVFTRPVEAQEMADLLKSMGTEGAFASDLDLQAKDEMMRRNFTRAIELLKKAEEISSGSPRRWLDMGIAWLGLKNPAEASTAFQRAADLDPEDPQIAVNLGTSMFQLGKHDLAVTQFQKALRIRGDDLPTLINLGNAAAISKQIPVAMDAFERACKLDPRSAAAWTGRGKVLLVKGDIAEATQSLRHAVEIGGEVEEARGLLQKLSTRPR